MEVTAFGFILLPLCLIFFLRPGALIHLALLASAFGAAAPIILNLGGEPFGLQSGFLPGLLFIGIAALDQIGHKLGGTERALVRSLVPMLAFAVCAVAGAMILPRLLAGSFEIWPQNPGPLNLRAILEPNSGNITQTLYVVINTALLLFGALYFARPGTRYMAFLNTYLASGYIVVGLSLWQFVNKLTGIYYPEDLLYSNPRWAILTGQALGAVNRINGPFTEPAQLATYLSGTIFACLWLLLRGGGGIWSRLLLFLAMLTMWLSTSTTGIVILGVFVPAVLLRSATMRELRAIVLGICGVAAAALVVFFVATTAVPSVADGVEAAMSTVIDATLDKRDSDSYDDRTTKDTDSIALLLPSYGLGAGWGSVRSSSLIPGLLGNTGILGLGLLVWFGLRTRRLVGQARRLAPNGDARATLDAMLGSVLGTLCAACLSAPTINEIEFYVRLALLLGCAARICLDARALAKAGMAAPNWQPLPVGAAENPR
jgi:hypothetical protein